MSPRKISNPRKYWTKKCDALFSILIRLLHSDGDWYCVCITCWNKLHWSKMQNGHFITRKKMKYRWDRDNCFPQDVYCNVMRNWNYTIYTLNMIEKYGKERIDNRVYDNEPHKVHTHELEERAEQRKNEIIQHLMHNKNKCYYKGEIVKSISWAINYVGI